MQLAIAINAIIRELNTSQWSASAVTATAGVTLTAPQIVGGVILRSGPTAAFTDTTDTAANIVATMSPAPQVIGQSFELMIANTSAEAMTLAPGSGVTFGGNLSSGHFIIAAGATRTLRLIVTNVQTPAVAFYG